MRRNCCKSTTDYRRNNALCVGITGGTMPCPTGLQEDQCPAQQEVICPVRRNYRRFDSLYDAETLCCYSMWNGTFHSADCHKEHPSTVRVRHQPQRTLWYSMEETSWNKKTTRCSGDKQYFNFIFDLFDLVLFKVRSSVRTTEAGFEIRYNLNHEF